MRRMLLFSFAFSFFLAILPHYASAVREIRQDVARQMLQWIGENARERYGKHLNDMKQHSESLAGLRKELATAKQNEPDERSTKQVEGLKNSIGKHAQKFKKLCTAAGQAFRTNRQLYATIRKIRPAEEAKAHKALRLVGKNAAQQIIKYANLSKERLGKAVHLHRICKDNFGISTSPSDLSRTEFDNPASSASLKSLKSTLEQEVRHWESWQQADKTLQRAVKTRRKLERTIKGIRP